MNLSPGQLDILFQALGDPTRRAMLERLAREAFGAGGEFVSGEMTVPSRPAARPCPAEKKTDQAFTHSRSSLY